MNYVCVAKKKKKKWTIISKEKDNLRLLKEIYYLFQFDIDNYEPVVIRRFVNCL